MEDALCIHTTQFVEFQSAADHVQYAAEGVFGVAERACPGEEEASLPNCHSSSGLCFLHVLRLQGKLEEAPSELEVPLPLQRSTRVWLSDA